MVKMKEKSLNLDDLACNGGTPIRRTPMPARKAFGAGEENMITEVLRYYRERDLDPGYQGYFEDQYTTNFCRMMGEGYADVVSTGTASLFIAIAALNLPKNSEVLVSPITDPGCLSAVILNGLMPKTIDSEPGSYNVGPQQFSEAISEKTSGAMIVHNAGFAVQIDEIVKLAHEKNIRIIEDCSQAHGATVKNKPVGTFGDIAAFSTMYRKGHMTGSSGGVVFAKDINLHNLAMAHADRGKPRWDSNFSDRDPSGYLFPALNFHSDEISCGIGIASLRRLPETIKVRRKFVQSVGEHLEKESQICRAYTYEPSMSPFILPVEVDGSKINVSKLDFANAVLAEGIPLNPHYEYLFYEWPWVKKYMMDENVPTNAKTARDTSFCLYLNERYGETEIADTVSAILKVEQAFAN